MSGQNGLGAVNGVTGPWFGRDEQPTQGAVGLVELLGERLHLSGKVDLGQFDRLSNWLNMQSGFIRLRDAHEVGSTTAGHLGLQDGALWVRLSQIVLVADLSVFTGVRVGVPIVEKQRRNVSILARGFELSGDIHVHAYGDMAQFLEAAGAPFLPMSDVTVRWLSGERPTARFSVAMVNRGQLVTVLETTESADVGLDRQEIRSA